VSSSDVYDESASDVDDSVWLRAEITEGCFWYELDADLRLLADIRARERSRMAEKGEEVVPTVSKQTQELPCPFEERLT
jgi:hypothetical protein